MKEAEKYHVLPLDDRVLERTIAAIAGRPDLMAGRTSLTLAEGMAGMQENVFLNVKNKSVTITAEVEIPQGGANGAILVQGGRFGGWALVHAGRQAGLRVQLPRPAAARRSLPRRRCPPARRRSSSTSRTTAAAWARAAPARSPSTARRSPQGRIERTQPAIFSADETADVGIDLGTPVVESVGAEKKSRFTGKIPRLVVEVRDAGAAAKSP